MRFGEWGYLFRTGPRYYSTARTAEPHPERVTDKGAVEDIRGFLVSAGVGPP
jgi:hypothetical protein